MKQKRKPFRVIFFLIILFFIIRIDLPENVPLKFRIGNLKIDSVIRAAEIDFNFFGIRVKKDFKTRLGLDLKGGSHLVYEADTKALPSGDVEDALISSRDIVEKRVNFYGVSEPVVQTVKSGTVSRIVVDLPGVKDVAEALSFIGQTAQLDFKEESVASSEAAIATDTPLILRLTKKTGLTGKHIKKATVQFDQNTSNPTVALVFTEKGGKLFEEITKRNVGKPIGIFLDQLPLSAPTVQQTISGGEAVITGNFTVDEAKKLAISINAGALPVPIILREMKNIGPTLGQKQVQQSVLAGGVGLSAVIIFMIGYYGILGVIASGALLIYGLLSFAIFKTVPVVLTLSGIAGFILSIGMAVDANILIFERIKEEIRRGKKFDSAVRIGFTRALSAIKDANITTLLVSFILFNPLNWSFFPQFGVVRGFALTLGIGVLTSLFTGVVVTKRLIEMFYKDKLKTTI